MTFKLNLSYEKYLNFHPDFHKRKSITKLRISAHRLEIELGRYQIKNKRKIEAKERLCQICQTNEVEDEKHLLLSCPKYDSHRKIMLKKLFDIFPDLSTLNKDELFHFIMKCDDCEVFNLMDHLLTKIIEIRGNI